MPLLLAKPSISKGEQSYRLIPIANQPSQWQYTRMPKIIPMPLEPIAHSRILPVVSPYARACVLNIIVDWWIAGCPPLDSLDLQFMARARISDWQRHGDAARKALDEITSALRPQYREKVAIAEKRRQAALKWIGVARAARSEHAQARRREQIESMPDRRMIEIQQEMHEEGKQKGKTYTGEQILQPMKRPTNKYRAEMNDVMARNTALAAPKGHTLTDK